MRGMNVKGRKDAKDPGVRQRTIIVAFPYTFSSAYMSLVIDNQFNILLAYTWVNRHITITHQYDQELSEDRHPEHHAP